MSLVDRRAPVMMILVQYSDVSEERPATTNNERCFGYLPAVVSSKFGVVSDYEMNTQSSESLHAPTYALLLPHQPVFPCNIDPESKMAASLSLQTKVKLRDNREIPVLGFGTYELDGDDTYKSVIWALEAGYRHIDSAEWYENEHECGRAILDFCKRENIPRSEIFYTTKLKCNNGYENVKQSIDKSIKLCGLGYIDLYLIHGPIGGPQMRLESWRAICDYHKDGKLKSIGISTFGVRHMQELINSSLPLPVVHQIDLHPFQTRKEIVELSKQHGIILEAWAPLVRGLRFKHPLIVKLSRKYGKDPAHILLRYSLQKGYVAIPKSSRQARIVSNTNIFDFELSELEMNELDSLDEGLVTDWDPTDCP